MVCGQESFVFKINTETIYRAIETVQFYMFATPVVYPSPFYKLTIDWRKSTMYKVQSRKNNLNTVVRVSTLSVHDVTKIIN